MGLNVRAGDVVTVDIGRLFGVLGGISDGALSEEGRVTAAGDFVRKALCDEGEVYDLMDSWGDWIKCCDGEPCKVTELDGDGVTLEATSWADFPEPDFGAKFHLSIKEAEAALHLYIN